MFFRNKVFDPLFKLQKDKKMNIHSQVSQTTQSVKISVETAFAEDKSDISEGRYAFHYTVRLENQGNTWIQLINRHWMIESGGRQIADVKGAGVVGEQPILNAGEIYEYSSWALIEDPLGAMYGSYTFQTEDGEFFDAEIPRFVLACEEEFVLQ